MIQNVYVNKTCKYECIKTYLYTHTRKYKSNEGFLALFLGNAFLPLWIFSTEPLTFNFSSKNTLATSYPLSKRKITLNLTGNKTWRQPIFLMNHDCGWKSKQSGFLEKCDRIIQILMSRIYIPARKDRWLATPISLGLSRSRRTWEWRCAIDPFTTV